MLRISLFLEIIRSAPRAGFWAAALTQAALWLIVPWLFYASPPEHAALVLAIGHEFQLGGEFGPPLAFWLAEIAFGIAGMFGVYLLAQVCVVVTYWAIFRLGSAIVGESHAVMAVLLMGGIAALTVTTPDFGPGVLAMALWALALMFYWRAAGQGRARAWYGLGVVLGLLCLTTYSSLALIAALLAHAVSVERTRERLMHVEPWIAAAIVFVIVFPHLIWLDRANPLSFAPGIVESLRVWAVLAGMAVVGHVGIVAMAVLGWDFTRKQVTVPEVGRAPADPDARLFVYWFAFAPALATLLQVLISGSYEWLVMPPLVVMSGLAVVVTAPDRVRIVRQHFLAYAWAALLLLPPLTVALAIMLGPWLRRDLPVSHPSADMARFFAESFERRTGTPLAIVAGDPRLASLVAARAPSRPSLYLDGAPERTPWVMRADIDQKGAVVLWPAEDTRGTPPTNIRERFPDLVPEVPRAFERHFQGLLPLLRVGWGVIRPRAQAPAPPRQ